MTEDEAKRFCSTLAMGVGGKLRAEHAEIRRLCSTFTTAQFDELMHAWRERAVVPDWQHDPVTHENVMLKIARQIANRAA